MDLSALLKQLEIEDPQEFVYMENLAELLESDKPLEEGAIFSLFQGAPRDGVTTMIQEYFEDLLTGVPDDSGDIYLLLEKIKYLWLGLWQQRDQGENLRDFVSEIVGFQGWLTRENQVICQDVQGGAAQGYSLLEAMSLFRLEGLGGSEYHYDFDLCLDYPIEEYQMGFVDLAKGSLDDDRDEIDG